MIHIDVVMPRLFTEGTGELRVQLELSTGSLTALVGPSGSGKTTLLRLLAGLEIPQSGRIVVQDVMWVDTGQGVNYRPQQRSIGYVFQDTALFPNMTVRENIRYAIPEGKQPLLNELIEATGLTAFVDQKPARLSGGQQQRVALARALIRQPQVLLLDEPFAALDTQASEMLWQVLLNLHRAWGTTTVLVSHHEADVRALADRVIRLEQGRVQSDTRSMPPTASTDLTEPITHIVYDESRQLWLIETATSQIQSANPAWAKRQPGDQMRVGGAG